jgi:hypothetical protein
MKKTILAIGILILLVIAVFIPMSIGFNIKLSIKSENCAIPKLLSSGK